MTLSDFPYLFLIPLFPLIGAFYAGCFGMRLQRHFGEKIIYYPTVLLPWLSFAVAAAVFVRLAGAGHETALYQKVWGWLNIGALDADVAFLMDHLSGVMVLVVTLVGSLIHIYSIGYMRGDPGYWRFFAYLNLFMFSMLVLVLADNFLLLFVGWEGVGLCSYLLISFWYSDVEKAKAGMKAFVVNRIGDAGFSLGLYLLFWGLIGAVPVIKDAPVPPPPVATIAATENATAEAGEAVQAAKENVPP
jgi:NADH-quinone oxidoreductase subunit L